MTEHEHEWEEVGRDFNMDRKRCRCGAVMYGAAAAPHLFDALDGSRLRLAALAVLGDVEVSTRDGSQGVEYAADAIAAEYLRLGRAAH